MEKFTIEQTIKLLGINKIEKNVYSDLIIAQLQDGLNQFSVDSGAVMDSIKLLDKNVKSKVGGERAFRGGVLNGLFYTHWFEARFITHNLKNHWKMDLERSNKFNDQMMSSFRKQGVSEGDLITKEAIAQFTNDFVNGFFERATKENLTGERIIFFKDNGKRYFLTLSLHSEEDLKVHDRIMNNCTKQFPNLKDLRIFNQKA